MRGIVAWFNNAKSFGFVTPSDGGKDYFVHYSEIQMDGFKTLNQGDRVEFEPGEKDGRTVATSVRVLERSTDGSAGTSVHQK